MKNKFNYYITKYFTEYLPNTKGVSKNTILSYRDTFMYLLEFLEKEKKKNINCIDLEDISLEIIEEFLDYLEKERKNSARTRNQRLASIHSFYHFIQKRELSCYDICSRILEIPFKKFSKNTISYFSVDEIEILINSPNSSTRNGFRDYVLLLYMYETASRVQEICDLTVKQLVLNDNNSSVIINGKGNKNRRIPISGNLAIILKRYINTFELKETDYVFQNQQKKQLTRKGIEYILLKYITKTKGKYSDKFKQHYSNHSMRHSRAMHLLESGVNIIYIRDFLGHEHVTTTEEYVKANPTVKEQQIRKYSKELNAEERYTEQDKNTLLSFLKEL